MPKFQVAAEDLQQYVAEYEFDITGDYGQGHHREIKYQVGSGQYRVYDHREMVLSTPSAEAAAEAFNAIRPQSEVAR